MNIRCYDLDIRIKHRYREGKDMNKTYIASLFLAAAVAVTSACTAADSIKAETAAQTAQQSAKTADAQQAPEEEEVLD